MRGSNESLYVWGECSVAVGSLEFKECACQTFTEDQVFFGHDLYSSQVENESSPKTADLVYF